VRAPTFGSTFHRSLPFRLTKPQGVPLKVGMVDTMFGERYAHKRPRAGVYDEKHKTR
jgi:hypothetical protein